MNYQLIRFASSDQLADQVATEWLGLIERSASNDTLLHSALSGGRITRQFLDSVVNQISESRQAFNPARLFWADERCVPPTDPESNFRLIEQHLITPLAIPEDHRTRIQGELNPEQAAKRADDAIKWQVPDRVGAMPALDLVFLGMGEDGHVASLFPGGPEPDPANEKAYQAVVGPKPPGQRVTLTYAAIQAAHRVWVLASGEGKQEALSASLHPEGKTPLARVLQSRSNTRILTDIPD